MPTATASYYLETYGAAAVSMFTYDIAHATGFMRSPDWFNNAILFLLTQRHLSKPAELPA